jgi:hypothetical protein
MGRADVRENIKVRVVPENVVVASRIHARVPERYLRVNDLASLFDVLEYADSKAFVAALGLPPVDDEDRSWRTWRLRGTERAMAQEGWTSQSRTAASAVTRYYCPGRTWHVGRSMGIFTLSRWSGCFASAVLR